MNTKTRKSPLSTNISFLPKSYKKSILKSIKEEGASAYIKEGTFSTEIVWGGNSFIFSSQKKREEKKFRAGLFLFGMVRKDAKVFLQTKKFKLPKKNSSIEYNQETYIDFATDKITATDLNHAYWRIAFNLGIISEYTYLKGLDDKYKSTRLAALSTLGRRKQYTVIKNGELTNNVVIVEGDNKMEDVYKLIRYTCFVYMQEVKTLLGKDFLAYKTDCIFYVDTKKNRDIVTQYFHKKDLLAKQLS